MHTTDEFLSIYKTVVYLTALLISGISLFFKNMIYRMVFTLEIAYELGSDLHMLSQ